MQISFNTPQKTSNNVLTKKPAKVTFGNRSIVKTLDKIDIQAGEEKYFKKGMPILAKQISQGFFAVQKFIDETTRFLMTQGTGNCTKLTMYDPTQSTSFLAHVDSPLRLTHSRSIENIQKALDGIDPKSLLVKHLKGLASSNNQEMLDETYVFMNKLGIPEKNLIEQNLLSKEEGFQGLFIDNKTGQTYNMKHYLSIPAAEVEQYKNILNLKEYEALEKNKMSMAQFRHKFLMNTDD